MFVWQAGKVLKKVAILQSNYVPWKGYFDMIASVDEFIVFDDMQYSRRDWRNRNLIKTPQGVQWLTVPVQVKGKYHQTIRETEIDGSDWPRLHWKSLVQNYSRAQQFTEMVSLLEPYFLHQQYTHLSKLNLDLIRAICGYLGIRTKISHSWDYQLLDGKSERLAGICAQAGGAHYVSGPAARDYIDEGVFAERGISVSWFDYTGYVEYPQLWGPFVHGVSVIDLIANVGRMAPNYLRYVDRIEV